MPYALEDLDAMSLESAQALPFEERDRLLDLIIAAGRGQSTDVVSYRTGLYADYFEEDLTRMLKVRAIKVLCRGTTSSGFDGLPDFGTPPAMPAALPSGWHPPSAVPCAPKSGRLTYT